MNTEYGICVILKNGYKLNAEPKPDMAAAQKWAIEYSNQTGVNRVIITETISTVLLGYKDGEMERPQRHGKANRSSRHLFKKGLGGREFGY